MTYEQLFSKTTKSRKIHEALFYVENGNASISQKYSYNMDMNSPFLLASITKLFTSSCILMLYENKKISLDDSISKYIDKEMLENIHIYKNIDYSLTLTVRHLLFQTSGLPDDFEGKGKAKSDFMQVIKGNDKYISFDEVLKLTKKAKPIAEPGKKAYYANINFDLLGLIIEKVTNLSLEMAFKKMIFEPLNMQNTFLLSEENNNLYTYFNNRKLYLPKLLSSCLASGGGASTLNDLMIFIKAYFKFKLFSKEIFEQTKEYKRLQIEKGPINYGGGYMMIKLDGLNTCFMAKGSLIGHSGSTGSYAFYDPKKDLFYVGSFSQLASPAKPIRFLLRLSMMK